MQSATLKTERKQEKSIQKMEYIAKNIEKTQKFAREIAKTLKKNDLLFINGDLGAGKSVFCREIIRFLSKNDELDVPSPTFTLVQTYETENFPISHYDLYRLEDPDDLYELAWEDALADGLTLVEWPEKLGHLKPVNRSTINIYIEMVEGAPEARKITTTHSGTYND